MGRQSYHYVGCVPRRRKRKPVSLTEVWLVPLMERYYEPNKPAFVAVGVVLLPFGIRFLLPSVDVSRFVMLPLPQVWNVLHTWLTPPMLFLLLNLVIGTIAVTSTRHLNKGQGKKNKKKKIKNAVNIPWDTFGKQGERFEEYNEEEEEEDDDIIGMPIRNSLVEPSNPILLQKTTHKSPLPENPCPPLKPETKFRLVEPPRPPLFEQMHSFSHVGMNKSESPAFVKVLQVPPTKDLSSFVEVEDDASTDCPSTDDLNAKVDDFIQKFKQQLMLQRVQSYREKRAVK